MKTLEGFVENLILRLFLDKGLVSDPNFLRLRISCHLIKILMLFTGYLVVVENFYIGGTVRRLETRLKEHKKACLRGEQEKSAVADHAWSSHYPILWKEASVVDQARTRKELLLKEALHIRRAAF